MCLPWSPQSSTPPHSPAVSERPGRPGAGGWSAQTGCRAGAEPGSAAVCGNAGATAAVAAAGRNVTPRSRQAVATAAFRSDLFGTRAPSLPRPPGVHRSSPGRPGHRTPEPGDSRIEIGKAAAWPEPSGAIVGDPPAGPRPRSCSCPASTSAASMPSPSTATARSSTGRPGSWRRLRAILDPRGVAAGDDALLERYAASEAGARGRAVPALPRGPRRVAPRRLRRARRRARPPTSSRRSAARSSTGRPFPDSPDALARLKRRFRLGVITNCDDDLFAASNRRLGVDVRLGRDRPAGRALQAGPAQLRAGLRADRPAPRADPARRPEPVPRPRAGQGARPVDRLDRPPPRSARARAPRRRPRRGRT